MKLSKYCLLRKVRLFRAHVQTISVRVLARDQTSSTNQTLTVVLYNISLSRYIEDLTRVAILYEIYE